ncbi:hypothetical protein [Streptomyces sp. CBMA156]|uniref:hypothetical protein n=1 Tax=Streptomyces sp. CBMA156 TaxID=1930280 RepID=UPI0016619EC7|nr:hypothetical protein [Streptomyces sp. CBMA156]MBD0669332.1 hypothetical protein [Streptomyces sp. CBMA156]
MTIDLLPGRGVRLPAPLPELRFGLTEAEVRALLAPHGETLPGGLRSIFVCGCRWALAFELPGVGVTLCADDRDRLRSVVVGRNPSDDRPACPVGYHGIDLLGWPAHELVEALRAEGLPVPDPVGGGLRHDTLHLHRAPDGRPRPAIPGRRPRHQRPFTFDVVSLSDPALYSEATKATE